MSLVDSPNIRNPVAMTLHRAARRQTVAHPDRLGVHHRIEHLRRQRVPFAQQRPHILAAARIGAHAIAAHHFAERMRMRAISERIDGLLLVDGTRDLHVLGALRSHLTAGAEQQDAGLFWHSALAYR